ncbi:MAG: hypothetical protein R6X34_28570 [Chloroflexota bacterium]
MLLGLGVALFPGLWIFSITHCRKGFCGDVRLRLLDGLLLWWGGRWLRRAALFSRGG